MSFPFNFTIDENTDPNSIYWVDMRYKMVPVGTGEPHRTQEVVDWDATARASAVIRNIGAENERVD